MVSRRPSNRVHLEQEGVVQWALYMKSADGTGKDELLVAEGLDDVSQRLVARWTVHPVCDRGRDGNTDIMALPVEGDRKPVPVVATSFNETNAQFSPDGRWIAFQSNESGRARDLRPAVPAAGAKVRISRAGGVQARWRRDGKELFYLAPDQRLMAVPIQLDAELERGGCGNARGTVHHLSGGRSAECSGRHYMVSRDGQRFLMDTLREVTIPITVVLNWKPKP